MDININGTSMIETVVSQLINSSEPELRVAISDAWRRSNGSLPSFIEELEAATWDCPELDVEQIVGLLETT